MTTVKQIESAEERALKRLVAQEIAKEQAAELKEQRRQAEAEAMQRQTEAANSEFESRLALLRERLAAITLRQTEWRKRLEFVLAEMDSLSDIQPTIQAEIKSILQGVENITYQARQKGAMIASDTQTHLDKIGGDSGDLLPFPDGITNHLAMLSQWKNRIASMIYSGSYYKPNLRLDGRRRL